MRNSGQFQVRSGVGLPTRELPPCWGYFGDERAVRQLADAFDSTDPSERELQAQLQARLP